MVGIQYKFNPFTGNLDQVSVEDLSGYVPYTGATTNVDLGSKTLTTTGDVATGKITATKTTEQQRLAYDGSNYMTTTVGSGGGVTLNAVGVDSAFVFSDLVRCDDNLKVYSDTKKLYLGAGDDMTIWYDGTNGNIKTSDVAASDLNIECGANKTIELQNVVYDDLRVTPGSFDRPGASDPSIKAVTPGGGTTTYLYEFALNNLASFTVQLPHSYKTGEDIKVHIHWTPGDRGTEENGALVGWKIDYTWANINGVFGSMGTADLSDACNGVDWEHNMTPDVTIDGHTAAKGISSMLICNVKRTDTGTDDTWASSTTGQLPLLLEIDFHYPIDTMGSRDWASK